LETDLQNGAPPEASCASCDVNNLSEDHGYSCPSHAPEPPFIII